MCVFACAGRGHPNVNQHDQVKCNNEGVSGAVGFLQFDMPLPTCQF